MARCADWREGEGRDQRDKRLFWLPPSYSLLFPCPHSPVPLRALFCLLPTASCRLLTAFGLFTSCS